MDAPLPKEGRSLRWWQKVLWFIGFYLGILNLMKLMGADAVTQLLAGIFGGIFATLVVNERARKRSQGRERARET